MTGMTLKQFGRAEFFAALAAYKLAIESSSGIVAASIRIHRAKSGVPKSFWPMVGRIYRNKTKAPIGAGKDKVKLTVKIEMDSAAFADDGNDGRSEAARLLGIVAQRLEQNSYKRGLLIDLNGNNAGEWVIKGKAVR